MLSLILALALTGQPESLTAVEATNMIRPGSPGGKCSCRVLDANTTTFPFVFSAGSTPVPICYNHKTPIVISTSDQATLCLTMTTSAAIGSQTTPFKAVLTDSTSTYSGDGACTTFEGGGKWTIWPNYDFIANHVLQGTSPATIIGGWRAGICSAKQAPAFPVIRNNIDKRVPFCRVDGDCTEAGVSAGTCSTIDTQAEMNVAKQAGCFFLLGKALSASTEVCACVER